jgi:putative proton-coupled thiamine transporter YuaJ
MFDFLVTKMKDGNYVPTTAGNIALFIVVVLLFIGMAAFTGYKTKVRIKQLTVSAMAITLAVVLSFLKFFQMPQGGDVTFFSMVLICMIGYLYGTKAGILAGIAYGFINLILGPSIYYPIQMLLDYPIAYGCLGLAGIFSKSKNGLLKGFLFGVTGRFIAHFLSGVIFFASYTPAGWNPYIYSMWYNASYILPDVVVTVALLFVPQIQNAIKQVRKIAFDE